LQRKGCLQRSSGLHGQLVPAALGLLDRGSAQKYPLLWTIRFIDDHQ
jgi:hypothetical protein